MPDFLLDENGLQTPRYADARALIVQRWKAAYGANAQTSSDSPDGLMIDILALMLTLLWEGIAEVYASGFFLTARGVSLDLLLDLFARRRLDAVASTASAVFYGSPSTAIPQDRTISVGDVPESRFTNGTNVDTFGAAGSHNAVVIRVDAAVSGNTYSVDIDATEYQTTAGVSDTVADIRDDLVTALAGSGLTVAAGGLDPEGRAVLVIEGFGGETVTIGASTTEPADLDLFEAARVDVTAEETGPTAALAGTLNTVDTSTFGIDGVTTTLDAVVGRNIETDSEFRARHLDQLNRDGCATPEAIRARLLDDVDTVEFVRVFENQSAFIDAAGRDPHSFETVVISQTGAPNDDAEIAASIFTCKPAGIKAFGDIEVQVNDSQNNPHTIGFSRGVQNYLHLDILVVPGEDYPTTGDPLTAIEQAVATYFSEGGGGELGLGDDFYRFATGTPVGQTLPPPQVASITVLTDATPNPGDVPTFVGADISVDEDAILRVDSSRITAHL